MMQWKLDNATGDLDISANALQYVDGADAVRQKLMQRFKFFLGEWFLDTRLGVPYFQLIFKKSTPREVSRQKLQRVAMLCPGIAIVTDFDMTFDGATRTAAISFHATLTTGEILNFDEAFIL